MKFPFVSRKKYDEVVCKLEWLLVNATGGKLSKHTYTWQTMVSAVMDNIQDCCNEYMEEANAEIDQLKKALEAQDAEYSQALHDKAREYNMVVDKICLEHRAEYARLHEVHAEELAKAKREVARKVIAEVNLLVSKYSLEPNYSMGQMEFDLAELEKKYTKGAQE